MRALHDGLFGGGVQRKRNTQRFGGGLAGMVVGRGAYAPAGKHDIAAGKTAPVGRHQRVAVVRQELGPGQLHATGAEHLDHFRKMLVLAASGKDFVAHDDKTDAAGSSICGHEDS